MSDVDFLEQFAKKYAWSRAPAKRRFRFRKRINHRMEEVHRLALTLGGVIDRALDDDGGLQSSDYSTYQIFDEDDLVFKLIDLENIKTSRVGYVPRRGIMSPAYIRLQPTSLRTISKYYYWFFYGAYLNNIFNGMGGGVRQNLTPTDLLEFPVPLPDIDTQQAIADFLDREIARIDLLIEKKQRLVELAEEKRSATITAAVTGQTDPETGERQSLSRRASEGGGGLTNWDGKVHSLLRPLKRCCHVNPAVLPEATDPDWEFDYIDIGSVSLSEGVTRKERMRFSASPRRARKPVSEGDVLVATVRTYLKAIAAIQQSDAPQVVSTGFAVLRAREETEPRFLYRIVQSNPFVEQVVAQSVGVSYPAINPSTLSNIRIPLPDIETQRAIADFLDRETALLDTIKKKTLASIDRLKEYRSALITAAVTGQFDVVAWRNPGCTERHLNQFGEEAPA